jgi:hypothetical protein
MLEIKVYPDGNQICAIIGDMPEEIAIGFGDDIFDALHELLNDMKKQRRCAWCFSENMNIKEFQNGSFYKCNDCNYFEIH